MSRRLRERHRTLRAAEIDLVPPKRAGAFRVALCYPNLYYVGMSNLGFQGVLQLLNALPDVVCERAFLPDDVDAADLAQSGHPLTSFESGTPLRHFHVLAFSVSFENDYLHVLKILRMAGIPLRASERTDRDPLVVLGGAAVFLNPEPLAAFADLIAVGEGEALVPRMMDALLGAPTPREGLSALREKDGFYVPSRFTVRYHEDGTVVGLRRPGPGHPPARLAGQDGPAPVGLPHAQHRDVAEVPGGDLARLPLHVPLLLGRLQLPPRARLLAEGDRGPRPRGARPHQQDRPGLDGGRAITRRSRGSWTTWRGWATRSRWPRCAWTT